jgi:hypothetical protein
MYRYNSSGKYIQDYEQHYLNLELTKGLVDKEAVVIEQQETDRSLRNSKFLDNGRRKRETTDVVASDTLVATTEEAPVMKTNETATEVKKNSTLNSDDTLLDKLVKLWQFGYNATDAFKVPNLSLINMRITYQTMVQDDLGHGRKIFNSYYKHNTVYRASPEIMNCSLECHAMMMCSIVEFTSSDMRKCLLNAGLSENSTKLTRTTSPIPYEDISTTTMIETTSQDKIS